MQLLDWSLRSTRSGKIKQLEAHAGKLVGAKKFVGIYFDNTSRLEEAAAHRGIKFLNSVAVRATPLTSLQAG